MKSWSTCASEELAEGHDGPAVEPVRFTVEAVTLQSYQVTLRSREGSACVASSCGPEWGTPRCCMSLDGGTILCGRDLAGGTARSGTGFAGGTARSGTGFAGGTPCCCTGRIVRLYRVILHQ